MYFARETVHSLERLCKNESLEFVFHCNIKLFNRHAEILLIDVLINTMKITFKKKKKINSKETNIYNNKYEKHKERKTWVHVTEVTD